VIEWFFKYRNTLKALNIRKRRNILNFDEAGFRSECIKSQEILILIEIREHYQISPENRKSLTIIEMINAAEDYPSPLMIIIQRQEIMTD
jgi:hypothetical protein